MEAFTTILHKDMCEMTLQELHMLCTKYIIKGVSMHADVYVRTRDGNLYVTQVLHHTDSLGDLIAIETTEPFRQEN